MRARYTPHDDWSDDEDPYFSEDREHRDELGIADDDEEADFDDPDEDADLYGLNFLRIVHE